jgi:hypothetical protein
MRKSVLPVLIVCATTFGVIAQAQPAPMIDSSWHCSAPSPSYNIPFPGSTTHAYSIDQSTCAATKGEIAGVKEKDGVATEFNEVTGSVSKGHGVFIETLTSGDKVTVSYTSTATMGPNNQFVSGTNSWTLSGGTGKLKGITGKGTCKAKGNADGTADFTCTGPYTLPK